MTDETKPEQTEPSEQIEEVRQRESEAQPAQAEPTQEGKKPKMSRLAVLSIVCLVATFAVLVIYLKSGEAWLPVTVERLLIPIGIATLALALVTGVIALVLIKVGRGVLAGRRLALLGILVPVVVGVAYVRSSSGTDDAEQQVLPSTRCRSNISLLAGEINKYRHNNDGQLPNAEKWCDILLGELKGDESSFTCPLAEGGRCSYSLNKYAVEAGADLPEGMVLLFESEPGWNQVGGPELFIAQHKSRRGENGCIVFANGKARFVSEEGLDEMNWNGEKENEEEEEPDPDAE
jgi:hypothetical protein